MLRRPEGAPAEVRRGRDGRFLPRNGLCVAEMRQALDRRRQRFTDRWQVIGGVARLQLVEEAKDARSPFERLVELEMEFRDALQAEPLAELVADERHRPAERPKGLLANLRLTDDAYEDLGMAEIRSRLDPGDRRKPDPRIGDLAGNDLGDLLPQKFVDSVRSGGHESISWQGLGKRFAS